MSALDAVLDAFGSLAQGAVAGLTVSRQPRLPTELPPESFPHLALVSTNYAAEALDYAGETVTWSVGWALWRRRANTPPSYASDGDRELLAVDLEALAAALRGAPTLSGACQRAHLAAASIVTHPEEGWSALELTLEARLEP